MHRRFVAAAFLVVLALFVGGAAFGEALSLKAIQERGVLKVGMESDSWGVFHMWNNGVVTGYDVDLAEKIAAAMGVKLEIVPMPWGDGEAGSVSGTWGANDWSKCDIVIAGATITKEREEKVAFSEAYFTSGQVVLTRKDAGIAALADVKGKKVGYPKATTSEEMAKAKLAEGNELLPFPAFPEAEKALLDKAVDAVVIDNPVALTSAKANADLLVVEELLMRERLAVVLPKDAADDVKKVINETIEAAKKDLYAKWFK